MHESVTTALDVLGLLGLAAGVYFAGEPWLGGAALIPSSLIVLGLSALAARSRVKGGRA